MLARLAVTLLICVTLFARAQAPDPFAGAFKDDRIILVFAPADTPHNYTGTLTRALKTYPLTASAKDQTLTGVFTDDKNTFPFTAAFDTGTLVLKTGNSVYRLTRQSNNPLDAPAGLALEIPAPSPKEIQQALNRAKAYLYSVQQTGHWDLPRRAPPPKPNERGEISLTAIQNSSQWGGLSALATYALLASGESPRDPKLSAAINFLKEADINGTYALAVRLLVWNAMPNSARKEMLELAKRDRDLLFKNQRTDERARPYFRYLPDDTGADHSASQFSLLGLWSADQLGAEVPTAFWKETETAWLRDQDAATGGWSYSNTFSNKFPVSVSMTAAGVASLFITHDQLHGAAAADCRGNVPHKAIEAGVAYLAAHANEIFNATNEFPFYTLYGIERIGLAGGYKYLGAVDWYKQGANALLSSQNVDGSWGAGISDTAFAMLFLARGRAPLLFSKLQYEIDTHGDKPKIANWNQRPRDAANLSRWLGKQLEREINWQIVNLNAPAQDLHDAPILYIAGNQALAFTPEQEEKLRQFAYQGGLILGHADCANPVFAVSFKKLGAKLFPPYEFRELPAGHLIYEENFLRKNWKNPPQVQGLSNGVRELMILLPTADPARFWQTGAYASHESVYELIANLFLYCSEHRDLRFKGDSWLVKRNDNLTPTRTIKIARLMHDYNPDPEPAGWPRLAAILHNANEIDLTLDKIKLGENKLAAGGYNLAHLTTTTKLKLKENERAELKGFLENGGTLLVDAAAGQGEAAQALESEVSVLANEKFQLLPFNHPLYANLNIPADQITYRPYAIKRTLSQTKGPRLKYINLKNRPAILFSAEDLSAALTGNPNDGITGYTPTSATALVRSILLGIAPSNDQ